MSQRLLNCLRRKQIVRLSLSGNLGHAPYGLPVALSRVWVVLVFFRDFRADGYCAVPLSNIERVTTGRYEQAYTRMCATDGRLARCRAPRVDVESVLGLLASLKRRCKPVVVNTRAASVAAQTTLGRMVGVTDEQLIVRPFDAAAVWSRGTRELPICGLLDLQWDSHYLRTYHRHLPPLPGDVETA